MNIIIHHNDADGRCAAAIVGRSNLVRGKDGNIGQIEYIEVDYSTLLTFWSVNFIDRLSEMYESEPELTKVFVVDFSLPEIMVSAIENLCELHWIDHHASAKTFSYHHLKGLRDFTNKGRSGCELAWEYCFPKASVNGEFGSVPTIVKLIGDYDTWRLRYEDRCKPLVVSLDAEQMSPSDDRWNGMLALEAPYELEFAIPQELIKQGKAMVRYRDGYASGMCKAFGFETDFEGIRCYAVNLVRMGSMAFGDKMKSYDACISFAFDGKQFTVSLYSQDSRIDCAAICKKHGGGGHKGAAGFISEKLPFTKKGN